MRIKDCLQVASNQLKNVVGDRALFEARLLLSKSTGLNSIEIISQPDLEISDLQWEAMRALVDRRLKHEPMAYLLGTKEFFGFEFNVNSSVLIPRPETEGLVQTCFEWLKKREPWSPRIVDLGVGSGCILLSLAALRREMSGSYLGIDISAKAIQTAETNRKKLCLENVEFREGDICEKPLSGKFDLIVSNPPYIPSEEMKTLDPDIRCYEPLQALDGREEGMYFYQKILENWLPELQPGGLLALETHGQAQRELIKQNLRHLRNGNVWIEDCHIFFEAKD